VRIFFSHYTAVLCARGSFHVSGGSVICLIIALLRELSLPGTAGAGSDIRSTHAVLAFACSVLDGTPCTPSFCSVFNHGRAFRGHRFTPINDNLQLTIQSVPRADDSRKIPSLTTISKHIADLFAGCAPAGPRHRLTPRSRACRCSVRFSFKRTAR